LKSLRHREHSGALHDSLSVFSLLWIFLLRKH
jgi:hypothetical protein